MAKKNGILANLYLPIPDNMISYPELESEIYKGFTITYKDGKHKNLVSVEIEIKVDYKKKIYFNTVKQAKQFIDNKLLRRR